MIGKNVFFYLKTFTNLYIIYISMKRKVKYVYCSKKIYFIPIPLPHCGWAGFCSMGWNFDRAASKYRDYRRKNFLSH